MRALVFRYHLPRFVLTRLLGALSGAAYLRPWSPLRLEQAPEPRLMADDWLVVRTARCGVCGSDSKQAFLHGNRDNPLTALLSFPHVLGHEAAGVIEEAGSGVRERRVGERVAPSFCTNSPLPGSDRWYSIGASCGWRRRVRFGK